MSDDSGEPIEFLDPYDGVMTTGTIVGPHMTKKYVLGVRAPSLSTQFPGLGRGIWLDCKEGALKKAFEDYTKKKPHKLASSPPASLDNCSRPEDFQLDSVFTMKWGNGFHWYGYGRPKNTKGPFLMFSRSTLYSKWKPGPTMRALEAHLRNVGQDMPSSDSTDGMETITLRAKRPVAAQ